MPASRTTLLFVSALAVACAANPDRQTLSRLHNVEPDLTEVEIENGLEQAMVGYRTFLAEAPTSSLTPEAMRRLADLKLEKEFGVYGGEESTEPKSIATPSVERVQASETQLPNAMAKTGESADDFEARVASEVGLTASGELIELKLPEEHRVEWEGPKEAIELYDRILAAYPHYEHNDQVLYQKARAYDELGETDKAIAVMGSLIRQFPNSSYIDEVQFRRGEYFFTRRKYLDAEDAYAAATRIGPTSQYYELALYKLGWTLYKQELHDEALDQYVALLDYKLSTEYDFDQADDGHSSRRVADTFRVISLSFSSLGGHTAVEDYFLSKGTRSYEDRIYSHLGEFYLEKLRYSDAAGAYQAFIRLHPLHERSPHFGMRVASIYETGGFPKLVLESKKDFAAAYALQSIYWSHFPVEESADVVSYLQGTLEDLATHYHAAFQDEKQGDERPQNFDEALHWYGEYLNSFVEDPKAPGIHYQMADLLLENEDFGRAAREYENTAYEYAAHDRAAAAGYAAIFAHREDQKRAEGSARELVRSDAVTSTLRFVNTFPEHEHAAVALGAAVDDLYDMKEFARAIETGQRLIGEYREADVAIMRAAWASVAHSHFDTSDYVSAEEAYSQVLSLIEVEDEARPAVVENLAAAIYKQGEEASLAQDHRLAADHFLRVRDLAPTSRIRPAAEYDAGAALIRLESWDEAAVVLEAFRESHPEHELQREATKQIASVHRSAGKLARAAEEYERVAAEAEEPELRREALMIAGELYEESDVIDRALAVYQGYVKQFPDPLETVVETRFKIAELYASIDDMDRHKKQLEKIVDIDMRAGAERTDRIRNLAARSALTLTADYFERFRAVELILPFEKHLKLKKQRMDEALAAFDALVDYEVGEATAGATYYIAEIYFEFSRALLESERPTNLSDAEVLDYQMVLEEEAYPFEEQAIEVHEKNLELMTVGVYNVWIEKSLYELAGMMPGRYAKFEESSGPIHSIATYAYQVPSLPSVAAGEAKDTNPAEEIEPAGEPAALSELESSGSDDAVAAG
jgi:tetratricopeptide (TPR) repeat protein